MLNLLPIEEKKKIKKDYYLSLLSISLMFAAVLFVVASVSILPGFLRIKAEIGGQLRGKQGVGDYALSQEEMKNAQKGRLLIDYLKKRIILLSSSPSFSESISKVLEKKTDSIRINSFVFSKKALTVRGIADTRNNLIAFEQSLREGLYFKRVALPIANLAKSTDNDFIIELTLP